MQKMIIAMWSGPRNLSTAMMRAFENRLDTQVLDEPFYAYFLNETGLSHPGRKRVLASQSINLGEIVKFCTNRNYQSKAIWYQKHMAQHNLEGVDISWIGKVKNCLLIRDPKYVISSYGKKFPIKDEYLLGYGQQVDIIKYLKNEYGIDPPIIDADDLLFSPENILKKLCEVIKIKFTSRMLSWPKGSRESDGVWAPFWYGNVQKSTGFASSLKKQKIKIDSDMREIYNSCMRHYETMYEKRITL